MKVQAKCGELVTDLLFKKLGQDDDVIEAEFYRLNPHIRADIFPQDTLVTLPAPTHKTNIQKPTRSWD